MHPGFYRGAEPGDAARGGREFDGPGLTIVEHTPAGRFGEPDEIVGTVIWLCSPAAGFVNGAVIPVDGGFGAFCGV